MDFLFVCKPDSHALLYEWVADFTRTGEVRTLENSRWNGKQRLTERYRYINQVPLILLCQINWPIQKLGFIV